MYYHFYAVNEHPFALTPDPKYLLWSESHREALASMTYGVQERKGFILILGEVGTGKTTLIRHILGQFGPSITTAYLFHTIEHFTDLLHMMLQDLEIPCPSRERVEMMQALNAYLLEQASAGRYVVLIIDEAQQLSEHVLEELRMLSNLETTRSKLLQIILVGQPELAMQLARPTLRQLRQRIALVAEVKPLTYAETTQYIMHRLQVAGYTGERVFTPRAVRRIQRASGGTPRLINVICDRALVVGYGMNAMPITSRVVKAVIQDGAVFQAPHAPATRPRVTSAVPSAPERSPRTRRRLVGAVLVTLVTGGLLLGSTHQGRTAFWQQLSSGLEQAVTASRQVVQHLWHSQGGRETPAPAVHEHTPLSSDMPSPIVATPTRASAPRLSENANTAQERSSASPTPPAPLHQVAGREVLVQPGDSLTTLLHRVYGQVDLTLLDMVKMANPDIDDINIISVGHRLHFPPRHGPMAWVHKGAGSLYTVHLLTTASQAEVEDVRVSASGHRVYVVPVSPSYDPKVVWYRVMAGDFPNPEQAATFYQHFSMPERAGRHAERHAQSGWQSANPPATVP